MACLQTTGVNRKKVLLVKKIGKCAAIKLPKINGSSPWELASRRGRPPAAFGYLGMRWCLFFTFNFFTFPFNQLPPYYSLTSLFSSVSRPLFSTIITIIIQPACKEVKDMTNCLIPWRDADQTIFHKQPQGYLLYTKCKIFPILHRAVWPVQVYNRLFKLARAQLRSKLNQ